MRRKALTAVFRIRVIWLALLMAVATANATPQEDAPPKQEAKNRTAEHDPAGSSQSRSKDSISDAQSEVNERVADPDTGHIYRLFRGREIPLLGINWRAELFLDGPLNDEPEDADLTLRRGRLTFQKGMGPDWNAVLSVEVSAKEIELRNNYLEYTGWNTGLARIGIFDEPFSLESMTSARATTFMERSLPVVALAPGKSFGAGLIKRTGAGIIESGLFLDSSAEDGQREAGQAIGFRYIRSPLFRPENDDSHIGISFSYRINAKVDNTRYRSRPETGITDFRYVDTGEIAGADSVSRLGLEYSRVRGPISWQAELMALQVDRDQYRSAGFTGGYLFGSWFLTGESRKYDSATGRFKQVKPLNPLTTGGRGSFELTGRISHVDLTDGDVIGGQQSNVTLGLNWRPGERWRVMLNLIKVLDVDRPGDIFDGEDPLIISLRAQVQL